MSASGVARKPIAVRLHSPSSFSHSQSPASQPRKASLDSPLAMLKLFLFLSVSDPVKQRKRHLLRKFIKVCFTFVAFFSDWQAKLADMNLSEDHAKRYYTTVFEVWCCSAASLFESQVCWVYLKPIDIANIDESALTNKLGALVAQQITIATQFAFEADKGE